ncbi:MAG: FtsQ-type POTRA domain-containing protein [Proteobacteria bacterium]|nr:FtsQ-type POTRA domain-containing protein [Pseudomonadota bacterium]MBU1717329.1 FtsQ-type POTRA domain-containing protein [Pseudomonadota bacterium]
MGLKRKLLIVFMGFCLVAGAVWSIGFIVYRGLSKSDFFQVTAIKIQGSQRITKSIALELSGVDIHTNLLAMDGDIVEERLEKNEWIERAEVDRNWPNRITITLKERVPVAMINMDDGLHYLDRRGDVFAKVSSEDDIDFPVITGLEGGALTLRDPMVEDALLLLRYAGRGNSMLPGQNISEVNLANKDELVMFLTNRPFPIYLGKGKVGAKYNMLVTILYWLYKNEEFSATAYIDMDYLKNKVLVGRSLSS